MGSKRGQEILKQFVQKRESCVKISVINTRKQSIKDKKIYIYKDVKKENLQHRFSLTHRFVRITFKSKCVGYFEGYKYNCVNVYIIPNKYNNCSLTRTTAYAEAFFATAIAMRATTLSITSIVNKLFSTEPCVI